MICWEVNETLARKAKTRQVEIGFCFPFIFFSFSQGLSCARHFTVPLGKVTWGLHGKLSFALSSGAVRPRPHSTTESSETFWWIPFESSGLGQAVGCLQLLHKSGKQSDTEIIHCINCSQWIFLIPTCTQGLCNYLKPWDFSATQTAIHCSWLRQWGVRVLSWISLFHKSLVYVCLSLWGISSSAFDFT